MRVNLELYIHTNGISWDSYSEPSWFFSSVRLCPVVCEKQLAKSIRMISLSAPRAKSLCGTARLLSRPIDLAPIKLLGSVPFWFIINTTTIQSIHHPPCRFLLKSNKWSKRSMPLWPSTPLWLNMVSSTEYNIVRICMHGEWHDMLVRGQRISASRLRYSNLGHGRTRQNR